MRMLKLPDSRIRVLVQGLSRARTVSYEEGLPHLQARIETVSDPQLTEQGSLEIEALMRNVKAALEQSQNLGKPISPEVVVIANNMEEAGRLADLTASNNNNTKDEAPLPSDNYSGRYVYYAVREHAMAAMMNGV